MSNQDFQDRLQRIGAVTSQQQQHRRDGSRPGRSRVQKPNYGLFALGALLITLGGSALRHANTNYEAFRDAGETGKVAGFGLVGLAVLLIGCIVMYREVSIMRAGGKVVEPVRKASTRAMVIYSLLGFAFGAIASLYMFMAAAARVIGTETAQTFEKGGVAIAFFLALVSLLFGLVGLFLRRYALGRVPVYFVFGGVLTYATVRIAGISMLEWQQFVAMLQ